MSESSWWSGLLSYPVEAVPAYSSDRAVLWHARSEQLLPAFRPESTDLVITDPPYGVAYRSGFRTAQFGEIHNDKPGDRDVVQAVLHQCVRLVGQKRHLYVFGPADVLTGLKVSEAVELIWDKGRDG